MSERAVFPAVRSVLALLLPLLLAACAGGEAPRARLEPAPATYFTAPARSGDSLASIAERYQVKEEDLLALNDIGGSKRLTAGEILRIPAYGSLHEAPEDVPVVVKPRPDYQRSVLPPIAAARIPIPKQRPAMPAPAPSTPPAPAQQSTWLDMDWLSSFTSDSPSPKPGAVTFAWPVQGRVLSNFGANNAGEHNDGINIATSRGTPIHAAADGTVTYVGDELKTYGNLILIRHENGFVTAYAHSDSVAVQRGTRVTRGQVIAYAGTTGDVAEPQLHFELRVGTKPVNPGQYLTAANAPDARVMARENGPSRRN